MTKHEVYLRLFGAAIAILLSWDLLKGFSNGNLAWYGFKPVNRRQNPAGYWMNVFFFLLAIAFCAAFAAGLLNGYIPMPKE